MELEGLDQDDDRRGERIVEALGDAFADLIAADPAAFRRKFRQMAADPFAFYRGSAPLFYADVHGLEDPFVDERAGRVWIQGDLHPENYGTYMSADGLLVFDVNDFDEAYLGHYTWDLRRMAAGVSLLGFTMALSDDTVRQVNRAYATAYAEQVRAFAEGDKDEEFGLKLGNTDGTVQTVLLAAREQTRVRLLEAQTKVDGGDRRFAERAGIRRLGADEQGAVYAAFPRLPGHRALRQAPAERLLHGQGRRWPERLRHRQRRPACVLAADRGPHRGAAGRRDPVDEAGQRGCPAGWSPTRRSPRRSTATAAAPWSPSARCRPTPTRGWASADSAAQASWSQRSRPTRRTWTGTLWPRRTRSCRWCRRSARPRPRSTACPTPARTRSSWTST